MSNSFHALFAATLPQHVSSACVKEMRANVVKQAHETYEWNPKPKSESELGWGINRYLNVCMTKPLPDLFQHTLGQTGRNLNSGLGAGINTGLNLFRGKFNCRNVSVSVYFSETTR